MNELMIINDKLINILEIKGVKASRIEEVIECINIYKRIYNENINNKIFLIIGTSFLKNVTKYKENLLIRRKMEEETNSFYRDKIEDNTIELIDNLFKELEYDSFIKSIANYFDNIIINREDISQNDFKLLNLLIENNCYENIPDSYINFYFKLVINDNYPYNQKTFEECIIKLGKSFLNHYNIKHSIKFVDINEKKLYGNCIDNKIILDKKLITNFKQNMYNLESNVFVVLFHEIRHVIQNNMLENKRYLDYNYLKMLKDNLLIDYGPKNYYNTNYSKLSLEYDAFSMSKVMAKRYLESIGIYIFNDLLLKSHNTIVKLTTKTDNRCVGLKQLPIDLIFDMYFSDVAKKFFELNNKNIFEEYPVLKYIYNDDYQRITTHELINMKNTTSVTEEFKIIEDILNNQIISYKEIIEILSHNDVEKGIGIKALLKRFNLNIRSFIDYYTTYVDKTIVNKRK